MGLLDFLKESGITYEQNVVLMKKTWIKTGGICKYWITPASAGQLAEVCKYLQSNGIKFDTVGQTSNIFFHSTYNPDVIVSTVRVNNYKIEGDVITCDCGTNVMKLAKDCLSQGYAGFYGLVGLPGTVAAAAVNNAGCFHCSISSMLVSADVLNPDGSVETISKEDFHYTRRSSVFKRGERTGIVLSVKLKIEKAADIDDEIRKSDATKAYRKNRQEGPKLNLGSVFSTLKARRNVKNITVILLSKVAGACHLGNEKRIYKQLLLNIYGYTDLSNYISDKQLNTFVWRDGESEKMFVRYKEFMGKVFKCLTIEIEEKQ